jgi:hypothetical protein
MTERPLQDWLGIGAAALGALFSMQCASLLLSSTSRSCIAAAVSRIWRWEFWPPWLFYMPVLPWIGYLSVRHRGFTTLTAANPAIPHGGFVGESKFDILRRLPGEWIVPTLLLDEPTVERRLARLDAQLREPRWSFPLVLKPDMGERGAGVRLVHSRDDAAHYLQTATTPVLAQLYHPGPCEAGIFYYRKPGETAGRIFSITDKRFPIITGDGQSRVADLIRRHPRYRMQAGRFLARLNGQADAVLGEGETMPLVVAGNHCQGAMFRDGAQLITPDLERTIDSILRPFDGFHFGRLDVRYTDEAAFKAGRDLAIVELNGATSESTNIYDSSWSILRAYRVVFRQWAILFEIAAENRRRGAPTSTFKALFRDTLAYYRSSRPNPVSD